MDQNTKELNLNQKTDLLKFQKNLNEQFLEIFSQKDINLPLESSELLGLTSNFFDINVFIYLKDLKSIATKLKYENSILTKSLILGFNQVHGNIYTIFNLNKIIDLLINNKTDFEIPNLNINSNILYLNNHTEDHVGLLINDFKLDNTADFKILFVKNNEEDYFVWEKYNNVNLNATFKKENISELDFKLLTIINEFSKNKQKIKNGEFPSYNKNNKYILLALMFNKIYLDSYGKKPIFVLDLKILTQYIKNISPF